MISDLVMSDLSDSDILYQLSIINSFAPGICSLIVIVASRSCTATILFSFLTTKSTKKYHKERQGFALFVQTFVNFVVNPNSFFHYQLSIIFHIIF
jgi:hypothetical protein